MKRVCFFIGICLIIGSCESASVENTRNEVISTQCSIDVAVDETIEEWEEPEYHLSAIQFQDEFDECLPEPNPEFMKWVKTNSLWEHFPYNYDPIFAYLSTHIDSVSTKIVTESDSIWGTIGWQQYFDGGILYEDYQMPEKGGSSTLKTNCMDMSFVRSILYPIIKTEDNSWNEDSTGYGPEGAGCYYEFTRDSLMQTVNIDWYCGC